MTFAEFRARADAIFAGIPADFREGIDGLVVDPAAVPHPTLPDIYTMGECRSETYPSEFGVGEVRSFVYLYHGSFLRLSELDDGFDWEEELWETVTHEVRHHLEWLAEEDALEVQDYVEDQNFARHEGEPFDPYFYRSGRDLDGGVYEVDGDLFVERTVEAVDAEIEVPWRRHRLRLPRPAPLGDVHFVILNGDLPDPPRGELVVVLLRPEGLLGSMRRLLSQRAPEVLQSVAEPSIG